MQNYECAVFVSTIGGELIDRGNALRHFKDDATGYHQRGEFSGMLIYGDGCMFHYLECKQGHMTKLKQDVAEYPYNHNLRLLYKQRNVARKFNNWQLVYAFNELRLQEFFNKYGWTRFNPYLLEGDLLYEFLKIVYSYNEIQQPAFIHAHEQFLHDQHVLDGQAGASSKNYIISAMVLMVALGLILYLLNHFNLIPRQAFNHF